ncbi:MAG: ribonuclease III [Lachnospiraceae bacterium]|nr:ribonuclease III [Lachnospiraceae bacterium]
MKEYEKKLLKELEGKLGYIFQDFSWLHKAMRHSSYTNEHHMDRLECNERLEFLGDAVLEMVSSEFLYDQYPEKTEGQLSKLRASLVCEPTLAFDAKDLNLGRYLLLGKGEEQTGGRLRDSIVSDAVEATIGAIYKDGGLEPARDFILRYILNDIEHKQLFHDSKTILQETVQKNGGFVLEYEIVDEQGPDHDKCFIAEVRLNGKAIGQGSGRTKKAAEQQAAYQALLTIRK